MGHVTVFLCPGFAVPASGLLAFDEVEDVLGVAPVLPDADLEFEEDLVPDVLLDLLAGLDADLLDERTMAADDDLAMVVLLDEDRGPDVSHRTRFPRLLPVLLGLVFDGFDVDGRDEGELLGDVLEDLLPDDLGEEEALRLVGDLLVRIELGRHGQGVHEELFQDVEVDALEGRDGDDLLEREEAVVAFDDGQHRVLADDIDLVDKQVDRRLDLAQDLQDVLVAVAELLRGVDKQADEVRRLQGRIDEIHHPLVQGVERFMDARVVDEDDVSIFGRLNYQDADARRRG